MANFNNIKHEIDQNVNTNGVQAITGAILNETLKDMIDEVDAKKQDTLVAGQNITIQGNVISATGGGSGETYTAGHGIDISSGNVISVDSDDLAGNGLLSDGEGHLTLDYDSLPQYVEGFGISITTGPDVIAVDASDLAGSGLEVDEFGALKTDPSVVQGKLTPGANIQISGNTISATDTNTTYSAGSGLSLNGTTFSVKAGSGLGFDANGNLINTGGGGGGTTYTAGDGIEIDSNDAINAKLGNGLQLDQNNSIEIDPSVVATQSDLSGKQDALTEGNGIDIDSNNVISVDASDLAGNGLQVNQSGYLEPDFGVVASQSDLSSYLRNDASGQIQNFLDGTGDTELKIVDGSDEDYVKLGAYETSGEAPHIEIFENGSGDTKFFYDHIERGSQVSIDLPSSSGTIALTSDLAGKQDTLQAGANIQINGNTISATDTNTTYSAGSGLSLNGTTFSVDTSTIQEKLTAGQNITISGNVISATGGSSGSYSAGDGIDITNNTISVDASDLIGFGLTSDQNNNLNVDVNSIAGNGLQVSWDGKLEVSGGSGGSLWTTGAGAESRISSPNIAGSAAGDYALAGGWNPTATGDYSFAYGNRPTVNGANGVAMGYQPTAGNGSVALGYIAQATGQTSFAAGHITTASGIDSTAIGPGSTASAGYSTAIGHTASAAGTGSVALGTGTQTTNTNEQAFGKYNLSNNSASDDTATAYTIGNGTSVGARSNSIEIKKNDDIYVVGVGGFDGTNASSSQTLQDVINNGGGGGGTSFTPGDALELDQNDNLNVLYGSGLTVNGNNELEVDPSSITGFLPLQGGTLQNSVSEPDTRLELTSPGNGDCNIVAYANEIDSETTLSLNSGSISEREPGLFASSSDLMLSSGGQTGLDLFASASYVEDNGTFTLDEFYSSASVVAPDGAAGIILETNSSSLSDTGNETREARLAISDDRGSIELNPTGFSDGTYTLGFPTLSQDETIATVSDLGEYLPLTGGQLQADPNDAETLLDVAAPDSTSAISMSADTIDSKLALSADIENAGISDGDTFRTVFTNTGEIQVSAKTVNPLDPTDITPTAYTLVLPQKNDTIATLSDISGAGSYSAGTGISLSNNVITNTAPGLWTSGTGNMSLISPAAKTYGNANGNFAVSAGTDTKAEGASSFAIGAGCKSSGPRSFAGGNNAETNSSATASFAFGQSARAKSSDSFVVGSYASVETNSAYSVAIGNNAISSAQNTYTIGLATRAKNTNEIAFGPFNNSINSGTTAEKTSYTIGNGTADNARSNLIEAKQNNDIYIYGVGGFDGTNAGQSGVETLQDAIANAGGGGGSCLWTNGTGTDSLVAPATITAGLAVDPAQGTGAISCGYDTNADGDYAFAQGGQSSASGNYSFAANNSTAAGNYSAAFGAAGANGTNSFAAVSGSADANYSVALAGGQVVYDDSDPNDIIDAQYGVAIGESSVVEGEYGLAFMGGYASGSHSVAIGDAASATEMYSTALTGSSASGNYSFAASTGVATGHYSSAFGGGNASGSHSVAIGGGASATEMYSTALTGSSASGNYSFAASTGVATGHYSSAFGGGNAHGEGSLASGFATNAYGYCSAAIGYSLSTYDQADGTTDSDPNAGEVALGRHNYSEQGIVFTVGCGYIDMTDPDNPTEVRQNAVAIDTDGKIYLKGLGGYTGQSVSGCTDLVSFLNNL